MARTHLGLRLTASLGLALTLMLITGLVWLDHSEHQNMAQQVTQSTENSALTLETSVKSIMLLGDGPRVYDWLQQIKHNTHFSEVHIYRRDGTEAFIDNNTIDQVNTWLGKKHFDHHDRKLSSSPLPHALQSPFIAAANGNEMRLTSKGHLTLLVPIRLDKACLACHGYDSNAVRGVLELSIPTDSMTAAITSQYHKTLLSITVIVLAIGALLFWLLNREVMRPLSLLQAGAENLAKGDKSHRFDLHRKDEWGHLAHAFDTLVDHLQRQTHQQSRINQAIIELSQELIDEVVLKKIGVLAMQITHAQYAMLSYYKNGEKQFIPLGMKEEELQRLKQHPPQGLGLLGLLWNEGQVVRLEHLGDHPSAIGFPEGHAMMTSFLGVPIEFADKMVGALYLTNKQDEPSFTKEDEELVRTLAASCAVALSNAQQVSHLQEANVDLENRVAARTKELNEANLLLRHHESELEHHVATRTRELNNANRLLRSHEIELELMNDELRQAGEAKNQFLANTSHELRTPLNSIIGFSDLLLTYAKEMPAKHREYVDYINVSGKRLLDLINSLLDLSKIEAGMLDIYQEPAIPSTILKFIINHLSPLLDSKQLHIHTSLPEADHAVYLDTGKLQQIWVNLIGNAIKFTPEDGRIDVGFTLNYQEQNTQLNGWVRDNGIGINNNQLERIFQPFIQVEGGLTREFGGTGLGLTLVRRLLEMQGGSIHVESILGEGSLFSFVLPVQLVKTNDRVLAPTQLTQQPDSPTSPMQIIEETEPETVDLPNILILDDDKARAASVSLLLQEEGYQGEISELRHVERLAEEKYPFLIMVGLPEDPVDIYRRLHLLRSLKATRHIPLVLLGGNAETPTFSLGTIDTMDKQVTKHDLVNLITRHGRQSPHAPDMTILVIDDEVSVREYIRECLRGQGYRLLLAANGQDGIQAAIDHDPDLIILDLMMPVISGFEVVEQLKRHPTACDIPVVIFSAKDLTREEVMRLGQEVEKILTKGTTGRSDLLRELRAMELLYPVQARLMDSVLRCYNLRYRQLRLAQECNRAERYGQTFSLVGWQMDGYDAYVQKHGPRWGIAALKEIIELVKSVTREGDVLVRSGESSFMLILTGTPQSVAELVAEKLRLRIRMFKFPLAGGQSGHFTASFGCVQFGSPTLSNPDALLEKLKARIMLVEKSGGDRCLDADEGEL